MPPSAAQEYPKLELVPEPSGALPLAFAYVRISEDRTGEGAGVDRQEREIREKAARVGYRVAPRPLVFEDNDLSAP